MLELTHRPTNFFVFLLLLVPLVNAVDPFKKPWIIIMENEGNGK